MTEPRHLHRAWADISLSALKNNIDIIKKLNSSSTEIMAVVKADAYGHGCEKIVRCLEKECGIKYFAVSNIDEAVEVRICCPNAEILILGYTPPEYAGDLLKYNIIQGIVSADYARELCSGISERLRCHIKIDTGMGRIGLRNASSEDCAAEIAGICRMERLSVEGIYTHFAVADSDNPDNIAYTDRQETFITDTYDCLTAMNIRLPHIHFMNSAAVCCRNSPRSTLARAGIIIYGLHPDINMKLPNGLKPVMSLKAVISHVKNIEAGDCVSYGRTFRASGKMRIATVTIGYADGYSRLLSSKGEILVHGHRCRILGRVCMDQIMIDVTDVPETHPGDIAVLIGTDGSETVTADELAGLYGTIGYEVVCGISKRVPRIYTK